MIAALLAIGGAAVLATSATSLDATVAASAAPPPLEPLAPAPAGPAVQVPAGLQLVAHGEVAPSLPAPVVADCPVPSGRRLVICTPPAGGFAALDILTLHAVALDTRGRRVARPRLVWEVVRGNGTGVIVEGVSKVAQVTAEGPGYVTLGVRWVPNAGRDTLVAYTLVSVQRPRVVRVASFLVGDHCALRAAGATPDTLWHPAQIGIVAAAYDKRGRVLTGRPLRLSSSDTSRLTVTQHIDTTIDPARVCASSTSARAPLTRL